MNLAAIEKEIRKILTDIERWQERGFTPSIEQGITLGRLQKVYDLLMDEETISDEEMPGGEDIPVEGFADDEGHKAPEVKWESNALGDEAHEEDPYGEGEIPPGDNQQEAPKEGAPEEFIIFGQQIPADERNEFIKELFANDQTLFADELSKLESMASLDDALIYIGEQYSWSAGSSSANRFIELMGEKLA